MDNVLRVGKVIVKKMLPFDRKKNLIFSKIRQMIQYNIRKISKSIIQVGADDNFA